MTEKSYFCEKEVYTHKHTQVYTHAQEQTAKVKRLTQCSSGKDVGPSHPSFLAHGDSKF